MEDQKIDKKGKTSNELISLEMQANGTRKDLDVIQLYLAERNLETVDDLGCYKHLKEVWLNGNKLRHVTCLKNNFSISHLFLQDNELVSMSHAISHLSCLNVLMLQNNQLTKLEEIVAEMKHMQALHTLNLYHNPLAQEKEYRLYVIFKVPSLQLLDREEVETSERVEAKRRYKPEEQRQMDSIAFGRRCVLTPTSSVINGNEDKSASYVPNEPCRVSHVDHALQSRESDEPSTNQMAEIVKKSAMQYSHFDWSKVPRAEERRLDKTCNVGDKAQIVTVRFR